MKPSIRLTMVATAILAVAFAFCAVPSPAVAVGATVQGVLTDASTSLAIEGSSVELWSYSHATGWVLRDLTISGPGGAYSFSGVVPGVYDVEVVEIGYRWGWSFAFSIIAEETRTANVALWPIVPAMPDISGSVVDTDTGLPVMGARVEVFYEMAPGLWDVWDRTLTAADGTYAVYDLPPISFRVGFTAATYQPQFFDEASTFSSATAVVCDGSTTETGIDARLVPESQPVTIEGSLFDATTKTGLAGGLVVAKDADTGLVLSSAISGPLGMYSLPAPEDSVLVAVTSAGYESLTMTTEPLETGAYPLSFWLTTETGAPAVVLGGVEDGGLYSGGVTPEAWAGDPATSVTAMLDGAPYTLGTTVTTEGEHELVLTASEGAMTARATWVRASVVAPAGWTTLTVRFVIDTTAPDISIGRVADGGTYRAGITPLVTSTDPGAVISASLDGDAFTVGEAVNEAGMHTLVVQAVDPAGNVGSRSISFSIDDTAPRVWIGSVGDGQVYRVPVTPSAESDDPGATLWATLNGVTHVLGTEVRGDGRYTLVVTAADGAGNSAVATTRFVIDSTPPDLEVSGVADGALYATTVTPAAVCAEAGAVVSAELDGLPFVLGTAVGSEGAHLLEVTATDPVGNATTVAVRFGIGTATPLLVIDGPVEPTRYRHVASVEGTIAVDPAHAASAYPIRFESLVGTAWVEIPGTARVADASGSFTTTFAPEVNTVVRAVYDGDGVLAPAASDPVEVAVEATVRVVAPASVRARRAFTVKTMLAPAHGSVSVIVTRRVSGVWRPYRTFVVGMTRGSAMRRLSLPAGTYRIVAVHGDADHARSESRAVALRVR